MNILIGDISSYKAIVVAKFIKENYPGIKVYTFDSREFTSRFRTKYSDKNFIIKNDGLDDYFKIIKENNIDLLFPVINEKLIEFWQNKNEFNNALSYLGDYSSYQILNDKSQLHALANNLDILVPEKYKNLEVAEAPFVIKPTNLSSSKGMIYINKKSDIPANLNFRKKIIQKFVKGSGVGYSFYCINGKIFNGYGHIRLAEYPIAGGSSTYRTHYTDKRMHEVANKIVKCVNYTGFAMFEFKLTENNELYLLEVNPRIWGSINQGLVNGVNYFEQIIGSPKKQLNIQKKQLNTYISPLIYLSFLKYLLKYQYQPLLKFLKHFSVNAPDVSFVNDPKGYLSTIFRKVY